MTKLFYRTGGTVNFVWRPVVATAAEIPGKRAGLFTAGYPTILVADEAEAPTTFEPVGTWAGKGLVEIKKGNGWPFIATIEK